MRSLWCWDLCEVSAQQATLTSFSGSGEDLALASKMMKAWVLFSRSSVQPGRQTWAQVIAVQCLRDKTEKGQIGLGLRYGSHQHLGGI